MNLMIALMLLAPQDAPKDPPRVEIAFVLDTTGSMGGLLEGAKRKIWSITNQIASGKPTPDLRVGLVAYRDKGDAYVTQLTALTDDLDAVHTALKAFTPDGGGDEPENVRQAMHDAVTQLKWSEDAKTLKIVFLVGDAPPHLDYADVPTVKELCEAALKKDIIINTIRCGGSESTGTIWQEIARGSEGEFFSIDQDGGVTAMATPHDKDLAELSDAVGKTVVAFGDPEARKRLKETEDEWAGASGEGKADRVCAKEKLGKLYSEDLVDACRAKRVKLEEVKNDHLPEEMQKMTIEEKTAYIDKKEKERAEVNAKIAELSKKRDAFITEELKKHADSFDTVVKTALGKQMEKCGVTFEK